MLANEEGASRGTWLRPGDASEASPVVVVDLARNSVNGSRDVRRVETETGHSDQLVASRVSLGGTNRVNAGYRLDLVASLVVVAAPEIGLGQLQAVARSPEEVNRG